MKKRFGICLWGIIACMFLLYGAVTTDAAGVRKEGRVLFISSYSYGWDTVQIQIEGIKAAIAEGIVVDYEFIDTKRVNDDTSAQMFYEGLKYRMSQVEPYDVVILGDDAALRFAMQYQEELFAGVPLVFEGVNDVELVTEASENPMITGVIEQLSVEKNIEFGLQLNPEADTVIAILDDTITGEAERKNFYSYADKFPDLKFTEIDASKLSSFELQRALSGIDNNSILIYVVMTEDASGKQYANHESIRIISQYAGVPALRMVEGGIGQGLLGGNVVSMHKSGELAAQMAMQIIDGTPCSEIETVWESPNIYCVDEQVMKKHELDMTRVPADAVIINHEETFTEKYQEMFAPVGMLIGFLVITILVVCLDNMKRRKLMRELEEARGIMESASQHDFLTGLPNRSKFVEDLEDAIRTKTPCAIMMLDIDDFKKINDTYGHTAGDDALKELASRLKELHSQILTPYRFAGDEFIIILKSQQTRILEKAANQCRQMFDKPFHLAGEKRKVCGSIGIASFPKDATNFEQLIVCADAAMYQVKKSGKNNFAFYDASKSNEEES